MRNLVPLLIIPLLISVGQLLFKQASSATGFIAINRTTSLLSNAYLWVALAIYFGSMLWWIAVLRTTPLSRAYGFVALSFVYVPILSRLFLGEPISLRMMLGTLLIVAGVTTIAISDPLKMRHELTSDPFPREGGEAER